MRGRGSQNAIGRVLLYLLHCNLPSHRVTRSDGATVGERLDGGVDSVDGVNADDGSDRGRQEEFNQYTRPRQ